MAGKLNKYTLNRLHRPDLQAKQIIKLFNMATKSDLTAGFGWYSEANSIAAKMAEKYGITTLKAAGIIAALSPGTNWKQNIIDANLFCRAMLSDMPLSEIVVTTYGTFKVKAMEIWYDCDTHAKILDVLSKNGGINKTKSFYLNLINPLTGEAVTVDRHAMRVALGDTRGNKLNLTEARYKSITRGYEIAANEVGVLPHELQAITWITFKNQIIKR